MDQNRPKMTRLSIPLFVVRATAIASLGGILFGYDTGIIEGALPQVSSDFSLTTDEKEWSVGILYLGAGLGAAVGGILCDVMGRKKAIMATDVVFLIGAILLSTAPNKFQFFLGRVVVGFSISVSGISDVAYLHEMAPHEWRGSIVSVNEACISLGFLVAFLFAVLVDDVSGGWRYMFGISGLMALGQFIGMLTMPESPVWLRQKGRMEEEELALRKIYGNDVHAISIEVSSSNNLPQEESFEQNSTTISSDDKNKSFLQVLHQYSFQCWIAFFLSVAQQLSGQASVLSYAQTIFSDLEDSDPSVTIWMGCVKFITTVLVISSIEYLGRRFLLLCGMFAIVIGQFLVAFAFSVENTETGDATKSAKSCAFMGILAVVSGYSASFGPLTWLITSELFPTDIRGRALGASTVMTYLCASIVTASFLSLVEIIGANNVFLIYGIITLASIFFVIIAIPETGKRSAEEIDQILRRMWLWNKFHKRQLLQTETEDAQIELQINEIIPSSSIIEDNEAEII